MKFAPLIFLLVVACGSQNQTQGLSPAPTVQAAPANQFGHLSPIQLPKGEYFDGWLVTPEVGTDPAGNPRVPERHFFSTTTIPPKDYEPGPHTHTLRDSQGVPVLIVKD